jgi:catechol 2,3-dioxygenase-like lactoylglutathione lyase family enzyme
MDVVATRSICARIAVTATLLAVQPVLGSTDLARSIAFYARLGFTCVFRDSEGDTRYAAMERDRVELHLQWSDLTSIGPDLDRPTYRFVVDDVDALHAEFASKAPETLRPKAATPYATPADTPWGTREFHVRDPDGNGLQFYRARMT